MIPIGKLKCSKCEALLSEDQLFFTDTRAVCPFCGNDGFIQSFHAADFKGLVGSIGK